MAKRRKRRRDRRKNKIAILSIHEKRKIQSRRLAQDRRQAWLRYIHTSTMLRYWLPVVIVFIAVTIAYLMPVDDEPLLNMPQFDKLVHASMFIALSFAV